jgi:hypothetical protein
MGEHFATPEQARHRVDPFLRAWEIHAAIQEGVLIEFQYDRAEIIDRHPLPPGSATVVAPAGIASANAFGSGAVHTVHGEYPSPPTAFAADPDVEKLWSRWSGYADGREPLQSMAYFCLTVLDAAAAGSNRAETQAHFAVSGRVLSTLSRLSSDVGDAATARKMSRYQRDQRPLTGEESA